MEVLGVYLRGLAGMTPSGPGLRSARDHLPQRGRQGRRIVMRPYTLEARMASPRVERDPLIAPQPSWGRPRSRGRAAVYEMIMVRRNRTAREFVKPVLLVDLWLPGG